VRLFFELGKFHIDEFFRKVIALLRLQEVFDVSDFHCQQDARYGIVNAPFDPW
jgi:hypothetical protein